jgi:hypothetical protein
MREISASFEDPEFEDEFFSYNPDEDPSEGEKARLMNKASYRARSQGISLEQWTAIHSLYYKMRSDRKRLR